MENRYGEKPKKRRRRGIPRPGSDFVAPGKNGYSPLFHQEFPENPYPFIPPKNYPL
jgi:hypothetical protein